MTNERLPDLVRLSELSDYKVADDSPDVRAWPVCAVDGPTVGRVRDLIVEVDALRARYIEAEPEHAGSSTRTTLLFPVASARIDTDKRQVVVGVHSTRVGGLPQFTGLPLTVGYDSEFHKHMDAASLDALAEDRVRIHRTPAGSSTTSTYPDSGDTRGTR